MGHLNRSNESWNNSIHSTKAIAWVNFLPKDIALIPRANAGKRPAMIIELKYDKSADTAIRQIKEKRYTGALQGYDKEILLVAVSYDKETKYHECVIESLQ